MIGRVAFPQRLLNEGERVVVSTRTHPKALLLPVAVLVAAVAVAILLGAAVGDAAAGIPRILVAVLAAAVVLWWSVRPLVSWLTTIYTFTDRRFIKRSGLVAKAGRTIPLNRISGVDFEIGVIDRLFGCGTLVVSDASTSGQVKLHDIPDVERVQLRVAEELDRLTRPRPPGDRSGGRADEGS